MNHVVRMAGYPDVESIVKLLKKGKLNVTGIEQHIENFLVVEQTEPQQIVGTAGLEVVGKDCGLLRSLAIDSTSLDAKVGMELVRILLAHAILQKGIHEIYLLTRSPIFFEFFGFKEVKGEDVPNIIKQSPHFKQTESVLSTVMVYKKGDT